MHRREFIQTSLASTAALALGAPARAQPASRPFTLNYAPHFGMFQASAGDDLIGQVEFMAAQGFRALEDNGMRGRPPEVQDRIGTTLDRLGMTMGVFVAHADFRNVTFASGDPDMSSKLATELRGALETQKRVGARWCTVVPGAFDQRVDPGYQTASVIENLRRLCELCEPAGLVMVLEPLNPRDHPGLFLTKVAQAYQICRAVNSPSCKILDDLYHQQVTEGNLIPNIDAAWSEIAYFQVGDNPGRKEPTTGEINFRNVFAHLRARGYRGIVGMEHGNSRPGAAGERAVIEAYRACDP